jgi:hypothetical protein
LIQRALRFEGTFQNSNAILTTYDNTQYGYYFGAGDFEGIICQMNSYSDGNDGVYVESLSQYLTLIASISRAGGNDIRLVNTNYTTIIGTVYACEGDRVYLADTRGKGCTRCKVHITAKSNSGTGILEDTNGDYNIITQCIAKDNTVAQITTNGGNTITDNNMTS